MHLTAPDDVFSTAEAAVLLKKSQRQVQRLLEKGKLAGIRPNGAWVVTAIAIWKYNGIEEDMRQLWIDACAKANRLD